jgi:hypothetical protein
MTDRLLLVYIDLEGTPHLVGRLWARSRKGKESATFEYDAAWLASPSRFALEPALTLGKGPHHTVAGRQIFGATGDSAPDRWGRVLIQREERRKRRAKKSARRARCSKSITCSASATSPAKARCASRNTKAGRSSRPAYRFHRYFNCPPCSARRCV